MQPAPSAGIIDSESLIPRFEDTSLISNQTASSTVSPGLHSSDNKSSTTLGSSSDSDTTTSESTIDDLSHPLVEDSDNFGNAVTEVVDDGLVGLSNTALLALEENAHLDQDIIHPLRHQNSLRQLLSTVCRGFVAAMSVP